ncbi:MAG: PAS domain S-box protein [Spirochaetes bacterium]|nr:PAS domain S-box protein [Spirochaetota bacterium]
MNDFIAEIPDNHFFRIIENHPDSIVLTDSNFNSIYSNKTYAGLFNNEKCNGKNIIEILFSGNEEQIRAKKIITELSDDEKWKTEISYVSCNAINVFALVIVYLISCCGKEFYVFSIEDITDRKNSYLKIQESEKHFKSIVNNISEYIFSTEFDEAGNAVSFYHSPKCVDITGYKIEDFKANANLWRDMIHPDDRSKVFEFLDNVMKDKTNSSIEHRIIDKNGNTRWIYNTVSLIFDASERIRRIDGFLLDVTEKHLMTENFKKLYKAVEQSPSTVLITNSKGIIEYVNPKFEQLTEYTCSEVLGKSPGILKSGETTRDEYNKLWDTISSGKEWSGKFHNKKKSGELYWEHASISPVKKETGEITHYIAVKEDITQLVEAEEALKKAEDDLRKKNMILEEDLLYAKKIQQSLLPSELPKSDFLKVSYKFKPLLAVGGDYLSFFPEDNSLGVFVADVVGHGAGAALFMSLIKFASDKIYPECRDHSDIFMNRLNSALYSVMNSYFITAIYAVIKKENDRIKISFSNGAHPPIMIYRKESGNIELLQSKGTIVGFFDSVNYTEGESFLYKGDRVYFYTDGFPETVNEENEIVGYSKAAEIIKESYDDDCELNLKNILSSLDKFKGKAEYEDDILISVIEII